MAGMRLVLFETNTFDENTQPKNLTTKYISLNFAREVQNHIPVTLQNPDIAQILTDSGCLQSEQQKSPKMDTTVIQAISR